MQNNPISNGDAIRTEREMSANQRGLIDTCFEEGQYETGIYVFDSLRSPETKPAATHIRQLLYLALYPPLEVEAEGNVAADANMPASPSKLGAKQQRSALIPTEAASQAAIRLLDAFASTNSPDALLCALPSYLMSSTDGSSGSQPVLQSDQEDEDSFLARQSRYIRESKHCWEMLKEGFLKRYTEAAYAPSHVGGRKRKQSTRDHLRKMDDDEDTAFEQPSFVGPSAWPVLKWLLTVFEKEEVITERINQLRYSPFLLSQIPLPRSAMDRRWDAAATMEIIVCCLEEKDPRRRALGIRLLTLLINITATSHLDLSTFLTATFSRLQTLPASSITFLLSMLPRSSLAMQFKLAFCKHILIGTSSASTRIRPKPQARARPRAKQNGSESQANQHLGDSQSAATSGSVTPVQRYPSISSTDILSLIEAKPTGEHKADADTLRIKYELVLTFSAVQLLADEATRDAEWPQVLSSGRLVTAINQVFVYTSRTKASEEAKDMDVMKQVLLNIAQDARHT